MKIAVTGATGQLGPMVIAHLKAKAPGAEIVALARNPANAADLGVNVRKADYDQPATLERALAGIDTLLLVSSSEVGQRVAQHGNVIKAARKAGIGHLVYTSLVHAATSPLNVGAEHRATEADIKASGLPFTFLRNCWYVENQTGLITGTQHDAWITHVAELHGETQAVGWATVLRDDRQIGVAEGIAADQFCLCVGQGE